MAAAKEVVIVKPAPVHAMQCRAALYGWADPVGTMDVVELATLVVVMTAGMGIVGVPVPNAAVDVALNCQVRALAFTHAARAASLSVSMVNRTASMTYKSAISCMTVQQT